jgi:SAM-dependent methyltransferase
MLTKKILRVRIQQLLRRMRLLRLAERSRYHLKRWELRKRNKRFIADNPGFALPPEHLAFDAYSSSHWDFYKISGEQMAAFLSAITAKYFTPGNPLNKIYEWGCGPGRIIRQLKSTFGEKVELHASDYNAESIAWCKENIPGVQFLANDLEPPLPYSNDQFDFIYVISVFTHLSETNALRWADELYRILRPGGILLVTTNSDTIYEKELLPAERKKYSEDGIVVRGDYEEGKKMYLAMHSPRYIREKLLHRFELLEHVSSKVPFMRQDYWVGRKRQEV